MDQTQFIGEVVIPAVSLIIAIASLVIMRQKNKTAEDRMNLRFQARLQEEALKAHENTRMRLDKLEKDFLTAQIKLAEYRVIEESCGNRIFFLNQQLNEAHVTIVSLKVDNQAMRDRIERLEKTLEDYLDASKRQETPGAEMEK